MSTGLRSTLGASLMMLFSGAAFALYANCETTYTEDGNGEIVTCCNEVTLTCCATLWVDDEMVGGLCALDPN